MKQFNSKYLAQYPWLILLTCESVDLESDIKIADYKDTEALYHPKYDRFIGYSSSGILLFGKKPIILNDGIYYIEHDTDTTKLAKDVSPLQCILRTIS
jgi:hypothetical protein